MHMSIFGIIYVIVVTSHVNIGHKPTVKVGP